MPDRTRNWDKTPEAQKYRNKYTAEHYDSIPLTLPKGYKAIIDAAAEKAGLSRSQYIKALVDRDTGRTD